MIFRFTPHQSQSIKSARRAAVDLATIVRDVSGWCNVVSMTDGSAEVEVEHFGVKPDLIEWGAEEAALHHGVLLDVG